ncbi:MAG: MFS transporter [Rickettsiaceae bacterium]
MQAQIIKKLFSPIASTFFMINGTTLYMIFVPIYLEEKLYPMTLIGIITSSYYAGMVMGAIKIESILYRIGHIRTFSAFIAIMITSISIPILIDDVTVWFVGRFASGVCMAAIYIVLESWFLSIASKKYRSTCLAVYMSILGLGSITSPFLMNINPTGFASFISSIVLLSIAIIPLTMQRGPAPEITTHLPISIKEIFNISHIGILGCFVAGFNISSLQSILPLVLSYTDFAIFEISVIIAVLLFGNVIFQYPVGYIAEYSNRYSLLIALSIIASISFIVASIYCFNYNFVYCISLFIIGGSIFSLYPVSIRIAIDNVDETHMVPVLQSLLLLYGLGSVLGPIISSFSLRLFGPIGFFVVSCLTTILFIIYISTHRMINNDNNK